MENKYGVLYAVIALAVVLVVLLVPERFGKKDDSDDFNLIVTDRPNPIMGKREVQFVAIVTEESECTYQWKKNGVSIPGANSSVYVARITKLDQGGYDCVVTLKNSLSRTVGKRIAVKPRKEE